MDANDLRRARAPRARNRTPAKYTWQRWLRDCSRDRTCPAYAVAQQSAMLTGQDVRALEAVAACWELYSNSDNEGMRAALRAAAALLPAMQSKCLVFAREIIAWAMNWSDRQRVWDLVVERSALALSDRLALPPVCMPEVR